ncbi:hypothetical protein [Butyricicoccus intestinisimiae]|jgi:ABC-type glycerol-3-phosphate transport system substrate-binding protein|uniref:hypothetical protein n=1 Tax=Butyricicoccus intestinisimiae TaxID=2841509 RepID=UPI003D948FCB
MKKKILTAMIAAALLAMLTACGGTASTSTDNGSAQNTASQKAEEKQPADLTGDWKQVNSSSDDSYQQATISGDTIEIYWVSDNGDSKSLYWAGSFEAPTTADEPYSWESKNDHDKTDSALMASSDDTKKFTYEKNQISYEASALGTTTTIRLEKQD